jgi:hypothetical protein
MSDGAMTGVPGGDRITRQVRDLLEEVLRQADFPGSSELLQQASSVSVIGGPITMLDLRASDAAAASAAIDGPVPLSMVVLDNAGNPTGELLAWVEKGYLSALEFAWWTDNAPDELPTADQVRVARK